MSGDATNINLYGLMTISLLTGLFTDRATQKLKEFFDVLFNPKEERPDPISGNVKVTSIEPQEIEHGKQVNFVIKGENFNKDKIRVSLNDDLIPSASISSGTIEFTYTIPGTFKDATELVLKIKDEKDKELIPAVKISIKKPVPAATEPATPAPAQPAAKPEDTLPKPDASEDKPAEDPNAETHERNDNSEDEGSDENPIIKG